VEKATAVDFGGIGVDAYRAALMQTVIVDKLRLRQTGGMDETIKFLTALHQGIIDDCRDCDLYGGIMMYPILREAYFAHLTQQTEIFGKPFFQTYGCYSQLNHKSANLTIRDIFLKQLLKIKQLSVEKATAIIERFSTFASLYHHYDGLESDREMFFKDWTVRLRRLSPWVQRRILAESGSGPTLVERRRTPNPERSDGPYRGDATARGAASSIDSRVVWTESAGNIELRESERIWILWRTYGETPGVALSRWVSGTYLRTEAS